MGVGNREREVARKDLIEKLKNTFFLSLFLSSNGEWNGAWSDASPLWDTTTLS